MKKKPAIFEDLERIAPLLPAPLYWEDTDSVIMGGNEAVFQASGALIGEAYVGKTLYDLYPAEMAAHIKRHNEIVMRTGETLSQEEVIEDITTGRLKYFAAIKKPLYDEYGNVIGIVGTSIDITDTKEKERLEVENASHKAKLRLQEQFAKNANQVVHDIRSPLASLLMIVNSCKHIPESDRIALREATNSIGDIANHLLSRYRPKDAENAKAIEEQKPELLSATLLHLLTDKKYQYKNLPVKFNYDFSPKSHFAFILIEHSSFKRMISNLINNAVDAFEQGKGEVLIKLDATEKTVMVAIIDNGKGMPSHVADKIMRHIAVTEGKAEGHGIGLTQVHDTLARNQGNMLIDSTINQGTQITLEFPRVEAPDWIAEKIRLRRNDNIVILDDDSSIHMAWDARFEAILKQQLNITIRHFENCHDAIHFIQAFNEDKKQNICLLTDFELLKQELNGLHVVEKTQIERSILVTSHYADAIVLERAAKIGTKILPKQLASEIPIIVDDTTFSQNEIKAENNAQKVVDLILVDDDKAFATNLMRYVFKGDTVDYFQDPVQFKAKLAHYPKNTRIYLDNNYAESGIKGVEVAAELHAQGFENLYLLTGDSFKAEESPSYLKVIRKDDVEHIKDWGDK